MLGRLPSAELQVDEVIGLNVIVLISLLLELRHITISVFLMNPYYLQKVKHTITNLRDFYGSIEAVFKKIMAKMADDLC